MKWENVGDVDCRCLEKLFTTIEDVDGILGLCFYEQCTRIFNYVLERSRLETAVQCSASTGKRFSDSFVPRTASFNRLSKRGISIYDRLIEGWEWPFVSSKVFLVWKFPSAWNKRRQRRVQRVTMIPFNAKKHCQTSIGWSGYFCEKLRIISQGVEDFVCVAVVWYAVSNVAFIYSRSAASISVFSNTC